MESVSRSHSSIRMRAGGENPSAAQFSRLRPLGENFPGKKFLVDFFRDESGQAMTEYILLLSVIVVGASSLARGILKVMDQGILRLGGQLEKDLKTGRSPLSAWKN